MPSLLEAISPTERALSAKSPIKNSPHFLDVIQRIAAERIRQRGLLRDGQILFDCASPVVSLDRKLRVLVEEVGEVAEAIDVQEWRPRCKRTAALVQAELVQVAAVAVAWLESLEVKP